MRWNRREVDTAQSGNPYWNHIHTIQRNKMFWGKMEWVWNGIRVGPKGIKSLLWGRNGTKTNTKKKIWRLYGQVRWQRKWMNSSNTGKITPTSYTLQSNQLGIQTYPRLIGNATWYVLIQPHGDEIKTSRWNPKGVPIPTNSNKTPTNPPNPYTQKPIKNEWDNKYNKIKTISNHENNINVNKYS